jgi:hypothetical protein
MNNNKKRMGMGYGLVVSWAMAALVMAGCAAAAPSSASYDNAAPPPSVSEAPAGAPLDGSVAQEQGGQESIASERKIIATASMTLVLSDTEATVDAITQLMGEVGGYVSNSDLRRYSYDSSDALQGTISLRVPADKLESTMDALAKMSVEVDARTIQRDDVTDQYTDVDAQLRNLEATEKELLAMLQEVRERPNSTTEDIMSVYRTLTDVRGQIETLQGRKNMWDNLISLSTINVTLVPDSANLPVVEEGWRPAVVAREAGRALVSAAQGLGNVVIWFVIFVLPLLLIALIPLAILVWLLRLGLRRLSKPKPTLAAAPPSAPSA